MASLASDFPREPEAQPPSGAQGVKAVEREGGVLSDNSDKAARNVADAVDGADVDRCGAAHGLSKEQSAALLAMVRVVRRDSLPLAKFACSRYETPAFYCQRFLRARLQF